MPSVWFPVVHSLRNFLFQGWPFPLLGLAGHLHLTIVPQIEQGKKSNEYFKTLALNRSLEDNLCLQSSLLWCYFYFCCWNSSLPDFAVFLCTRIIKMYLRCLDTMPHQILIGHWDSQVYLFFCSLLGWHVPLHFIILYVFYS